MLTYHQRCCVTLGLWQWCEISFTGWQVWHENLPWIIVFWFLNKISFLFTQEPLQGHETQEVSCCCCVSGDVEAQFTLGKQGYVPGENIHIQAEIHNRSNTETNGSSCTLLQVRGLTHYSLGNLFLWLLFRYIEVFYTIRGFCSN